MSGQPIAQDVLCKSDDRIAMHLEFISTTDENVHPCARKHSARGNGAERALDVLLNGGWAPGRTSKSEPAANDISVSIF